MRDGGAYCSGVGGIDGLARAGVDGGSVAEEDVSALGDQLSGKFLALRGVGEGVGIGEIGRASCRERV